MPLGLLIAMIVMATAFLANGRVARDPFWLGLGLVNLGMAALMLVRDGLSWVVFAGPVSGTLALFMLLLGLFFWAEFLGLPRWWAYRLGIGLVNRALTFDARLHAIRAPFAEAIRRAQLDPDGRSEALSQAQGQVRLERELRPPDSAWADLRDDIADDDQAWIDLIRAGAPLERFADHVQAFEPVLARWEHLQGQASEEQRLMSSPGLRRRGAIVALATLSVSLLLAGLAAARAYDLLETGVARTAAWGALGMLMGGAIGLAYTLVTAFKGR